MHVRVRFCKLKFRLVSAAYAELMNAIISNKIMASADNAGVT